MVAKCANPECTTSFRYYREGRLFRIEVDANTPGVIVIDKKPARRLEHFWLCGDCASRMTLVYERGKGIITVPAAMRQRPTRRAAAG